jgi:hypothetical protein
MKLAILHEGHWTPISGYGPNSTIKTKKKKHQMSFLKYPEDRARFIKWSNQKKK